SDDRNGRMTNIINEIDEDIRRERFERLWKRYGPWLIGLCVLVVASVAGYKVWQNYEETTRLARAKLFAEAIALEAQENVGVPQRLEHLRALTNKGDGFAQLAQWNIAHLAMQNGDYLLAVDTFNTIAASPLTDADFRPWARLLALQAGSANPPEDWQTRIDNISADDPRWVTMAKIIAANISLEIGDEALAKSYLQEVIDTTTNIPPVILDLYASLP
ncbi:MAG: tetratricopeptide repeat protein, partial [Pseudomonadota bacterium]